jgi:hypothetical protein
MLRNINTNSKPITIFRNLYMKFRNLRYFVFFICLELNIFIQQYHQFNSLYWVGTPIAYAFMTHRFNRVGVNSRHVVSIMSLMQANSWRHIGAESK